MILSDAEMRRILGIHFCPVCAVDTMPEEATGQCFWCRTKIARANPAANIDIVRLCSFCNQPIPEEKQRGTEYCSELCRRRSWHKRNPRVKPRKRPLICRNCDGPIKPPPTPGRPPLYCSASCRQDWWRKRQNAERRAAA